MALDQEFEQEIDEAEGEGMTFFDHLEELRWHIIRSIISILVFTIIAWIYQKEIFGGIIMAPTKVTFWTNRMLCKLADITSIDGLCFKPAAFILQSREVSGQFMMAFSQSIMVGLLFAFPYFFWEIWRFIKPGLKVKEAKAARGAVFWVSMLFFLGVLFGYYIVSPMAINFSAFFRKNLQRHSHTRTLSFGLSCRVGYVHQSSKPNSVYPLHFGVLFLKGLCERIHTE